MKVYGIKNCNTVKKAFDWLEQNNIPFEFHDYKKLGISREKLQEWSNKVGWEKLLNKKGTTWKQLPLELQESITSEDAAFALMQEKTSVIKRPVIESDNVLLVGFEELKYREAWLKE